MPNQAPIEAECQEKALVKAVYRGLVEQALEAAELPLSTPGGRCPSMRTRTQIPLSMWHTTDVTTLPLTKPCKKCGLALNCAYRSRAAAGHAGQRTLMEQHGPDSQRYCSTPPGVKK